MKLATRPLSTPGVTRRQMIRRAAAAGAAAWAAPVTLESLASPATAATTCYAYQLHPDGNAGAKFRRP